MTEPLDFRAVAKKVRADTIDINVAGFDRAVENTLRSAHAAGIKVGRRTRYKKGHFRLRINRNRSGRFFVRVVECLDYVRPVPGSVASRLPRSLKNWV